MGIIKSIDNILTTITGWFKKTEVEKERDEIARLQDESSKIGDAINKASEGKTGDLERLIND